MQNNQYFTPMPTNSTAPVENRYFAQPQTNQTAQQNSLLTIFVNSEDEVNYYPVAAGVTVMLIAFNLGKFYFKTTGKNGVPEPLRVFKFEEVIQMPPVNTNENFATKDEIKDLSDKLNKLIESLGGDK